MMLRCARVCLLIALLFLLNPAPARACSYGDLPDTDEELFALLFSGASAVFLARVVRAEEVEGLSRLGVEVEATYRVVEIFKGQPPKDGKVRSLRSEEANCAAQLLAAQDYLFFLDKDRLVWGLNARRINPEWDYHKGLLEKLRKLSRDAR